MEYKIGICGAGTWGIALAQMLSDYCHVMVWSAITSEIDQLSATRVHPNLKDVMLSERIVFTKQIAQVCENEYLVVAVPSVFVRPVAEQMLPYVSDETIVIDVAKGLEKDTCSTMSEVLKDVFADRCTNIVALSGPTHAEEVVKGMPTTIVAASDRIEAAQKVQRVFNNKTMRVYTNSDTKGVEICGAVKNIIALAAGVSAGLGYGDNARAALITRGCAEMTRLGTALGCMPQTFTGLAGIGDLIVTATSVHSRNNRAGYLIGQGTPVEQAIQEVGMVVEGMHAILPVRKLAQEFAVDMPIVSAMYDIVYGNVPPAQAASGLFNRELKSELEEYGA